jgi:hypothetical protein
VAVYRENGRQRRDDSLEINRLTMDGLNQDALQLILSAYKREPRTMGEFLHFPFRETRMLSVIVRP